MVRVKVSVYNKEFPKYNGLSYMDVYFSLPHNSYEMRPAPHCHSRTQVLLSHCSAIPLGNVNNCMIETWSASDAGSSQSGKWRRSGGGGPCVLDLEVALSTSSTGLCQELGHRTSPKPEGGGET